VLGKTGWGNRKRGQALSSNVGSAQFAEGSGELFAVSQPDVLSHEAQLTVALTSPPSAPRMPKGPATWNCRQSVVSSSTTAVSAFVPGVARGSAAKPPAAPVSQIAIMASAVHTRASPCLHCFLFIRCSFF
jgi:hypothetical protein